MTPRASVSSPSASSEPDLEDSGDDDGVLAVSFRFTIKPRPTTSQTAHLSILSTAPFLSSPTLTSPKSPLPSSFFSVPCHIPPKLLLPWLTSPEARIEAEYRPGGRPLTVRSISVRGGEGDEQTWTRRARPRTGDFSRIGELEMGVSRIATAAPGDQLAILSPIDLII